MSHIDQGTLHAYLDGELKDARRAQVEEHVDACAACRERLEEARAATRQASGLLNQIEPQALQPPPWHELEARADSRRSAPRRRGWLGPSLAWAASIALAFGLGWFSRTYWTHFPADVPGLRPAAEAPVAAADDAADEMEEADRPAEPGASGVAAKVSQEPQATEGRSFEAAQRAQTESAQPPAPARPDAADELARRAQPEEAVAQEPLNEAVERRSRKSESEAAPAEQAPRQAEREPRRAEEEAPTTHEIRERQALRDQAQTIAARRLAEPQVAARPDTIIALPGDAVPREVAGAGGESAFVAVDLQAARSWLGTAPRTLPQLSLRGVEVGPGIAAPDGVAGLPALRLIYVDPDGREIVLTQQWVGREIAGGRESRLLVRPSGVATYLWYDDSGYRLSLTGAVGADSLRHLATEVK